MPDRVILFIDYQNVYRGARDCFHPELYAAHIEGQISPTALGELLSNRGLNPRRLTQVRVYRGQPAEKRDRKGFSACTRQIAAWAHDSRVKSVTRTLRYPHGWPGACQAGEKPQEKGVDVALAIDFVRLAIEDRYDVGILMSTDTDLKPALEIVTQLRDMGGAMLGPRSRRGAGAMVATAAVFQ